MSIWDRLRGIRQETAVRVTGTTTTKNAPPTYVSDFVQEQAWLRDEMEHRGKMARRSAAARNMTYGLASNVFDDGLRFVSKEDPEKEVMQDILQEMERMDYIKWYSLVLGYALAYGHGWLLVGDEDMDYRVDAPTDATPRIANLDAFNPENTEVTVYDDIGAPAEITIKVLTNTGKSEANVQQLIPVDAGLFQLIRLEPFDRSHEGVPSTYAAWNALCGIELLLHSMISYDMKIGMGALVMTTKGTITSTDADAAKAAMEDLSVTRVAVVPGRAVEKLEFIGAGAGQTDFGVHMDMLLSQVAAASKIPKNILVGDSAGAITGSEVNSRALYAVIQGLQSKMEPYIRDLVRRMGYLSDDYDIEWNVRYATDELQAAQIRVLNAQADEAEQRIENMKKGDNPFDIKVKLGDKGAKEKTQNPEGRQ